jgi:hypothetical protein
MKLGLHREIRGWGPLRAAGGDATLQRIVAASLGGGRPSLRMDALSRVSRDAGRLFPAMQGSTTVAPSAVP